FSNSGGDTFKPPGANIIAGSIAPRFNTWKRPLPRPMGGGAAGIPGAWPPQGSGLVTCLSRNAGIFRPRGASPHEILNWIWDGHCADVGRGFSRKCGIGDRLLVAGRNRPSSRGAALAGEQPAPGCGTGLGTGALR